MRAKSVCGPGARTESWRLEFKEATSVILRGGIPVPLMEHRGADELMRVALDNGLSWTCAGSNVARLHRGSLPAQHDGRQIY